MYYKKPYWLKISIISIIILGTSFFSGCQYSDNNITEFISDFESGSIGNVEQNDTYQWTISLKNDNNNDTLPDKWRAWWYLRIENAPIDAPIIINLNKRGWPYYYIPVYSYDNKTWLRFKEDEISQPANYELTIKKQFSNKRIWLARFYPYTYSQLNSFLNKINSSSRVFKETIGKTTYNRPIEMLTITDFSINDAEKHSIWIHARTHPAETGSSYLLEGLIDFLISGQPDANKALTSLVFHIVPMQNIDGVIEGNYRTTPDSDNLEVMWFPDTETANPLDLKNDVPPEIQSLNQAIRKLIEKESRFSIALNLHSSNSEPDTAAFFYPHFGPKSLGYSESEASLWKNQISFINNVATFYNNRIEPIPAEGGSYFASRYYPESWWWKNFQHDVMAITMETVYGRGGYAPNWLTQNDLRELGQAVGHAIMLWHNIPVRQFKKTKNIQRLFNRNNLRFPYLYPPKAKDEMKE